MKNEKTYPIKAVAEITGLSVHVIRAWEKRYNAITPRRTETNRRLYAESDVEKLSFLLKLTEKGHNIGGIAGLSLNELKEMFNDVIDTSFQFGDSRMNISVSPEDFQKKCLDAVNRFDAKLLESTIYNASIALSQPALFEQVFIPLAKTIGNRWKSGEIRIYQEHMFSRIVKRYLLEAVEKNNLSEMAPNLVVAIPQQQLHEIGALIAAAYAASDGWRVTYLSPNLPAEEIIAGAIKINAKVIVYSIVYTEDHLTIIKDLQKFGAVLPEDIKLIVGGDAAAMHKKTIEDINGVMVRNFSDYRKVISNLRQGYVN